MRKRGIAAAALLALALRGAVLAGAGAPVERFIRAHWGDGQLVQATLNVELGGRAGEANDAAAEPEPPEDAASDAEAQPQRKLRLVAVTPPAHTELAAESAPAEAPETEQATAEIRAADLSGKSVVHNAAELDVDLEALAAEGLQLRLPAAGPQVLIIHTHSSEAYTPAGADQYVPSDPYRTQDAACSVIRVGDALTEALEAHGLTVLHDRGVYDYPSYTGSYSRSGAVVERYLADYPSIRVVIDLHRDALGSGDVVYKTQAVVGTGECAQLMMVVGTGANGLPHPNWRENLKLAMYLQNAASIRSPSLTRPVELVKERYNQQLSPGMLILEVGSTGNTLQEALTAVRVFGDAAGEALTALME